MPIDRCNKSLFGALIVGALWISACNFPTGSTPAPPSPDIIKTSAAQTVEAQLTQAAVGQPPSDTPLPVPPSETPGLTALPTATQAPPAATSTPAPSPTSATAEAPCDRAGFVRDVTFPDGTKVMAGETYRKTWRLRNTGTCTWNSSYTVVFVSGDAMGGPASTNLTTGSVAPGGELDISIDLKAPENPGTYRGNWKLRNPSGVVFGLGTRAEREFWVEIEVPGPTETPTATVTPNLNFNLSFENVHTCGGEPHATLRIENNSNVKLESAQITIVDQTTGTTLFGPSTRNVDFMFTAGECPPGGEDIPASRTKFLAASLTASPTSGNTARVTMKLCTLNDLGGTCLEKSVEFTIP